MADPGVSELGEGRSPGAVDLDFLGSGGLFRCPFYTLPMLSMVGVNNKMHIVNSAS